MNDILVTASAGILSIICAHLGTSAPETDERIVLFILSGVLAALCYWCAKLDLHEWRQRRGR